MDLGKRITIVILLVTIGISVKMIRDQSSSIIDAPEIAGKSSSWLYRKGIKIENDRERLTFTEDVEITINTKELIELGKLQPTCNDMRFLDEDNESSIEFEILGQPNTEDGCNSENTKVSVKITSIPAEGKTIYLLYGNSTAPKL
ncbi:MAG: DUF2341 domain-containing protein [Candidatus Dojkabacteria bacterium]